MTSSSAPQVTASASATPTTEVRTSPSATDKLSKYVRKTRANLIDIDAEFKRLESLFTTDAKSNASKSPSAGTDEKLGTAATVSLAPLTAAEIQDAKENLFIRKKGWEEQKEFIENILGTLASQKDIDTPWLISLADKIRFNFYETEMQKSTLKSMRNLHEIYFGIKRHQMRHIAALIDELVALSMAQITAATIKKATGLSHAINEYIVEYQTKYGVEIHYKDQERTQALQLIFSHDKATVDGRTCKVPTSTANMHRFHQQLAKINSENSRKSRIQQPSTSHGNSLT